MYIVDKEIKNMIDKNKVNFTKLLKRDGFLLTYDLYKKENNVSYNKKLLLVLTILEEALINDLNSTSQDKQQNI